MKKHIPGIIGIAACQTPFGFIADRFSYSHVYWAAAALTVIALALYLKAVAEKKKRPV